MPSPAARNEAGVRERKRVPDIDLSRCSCCQGCQALCPDVFRLNPAGYMEVADLDQYPVECVDEAAGKCPEDCISWVETGPRP